MDPHIAHLNLSTPAINQWKEMPTESRMFWSDYFELTPLEDSCLRSFGQYAHTYTYCLNNDDVMRVIYCAVVEILRYNNTHHMQHAFIGNSGGLDSAITCGLLSKAARLSQELGIDFHILAYGLPIYSNPDHNARALETSQIFGIQHETIEDLDTLFDTFQKTLLPLADRLAFNEEQRRRSLGNVKARIRMIINFFGTTQPGSYVVSTDNLSELYMAFWTLMGDVGAFGPIQNILKGLELPAIAYALGVPERTIQAKPTDGLGVHQSLDHDEGGDVDAFHGVRYPDLDAIICHAVVSGLDLCVSNPVHVPADAIHSPQATQEVIDRLIAQMTSPASVWKRTNGSIGTAISREQMGLPSLKKIASRL